MQLSLTTCRIIWTGERDVAERSNQDRRHSLNYTNRKEDGFGFPRLGSSAPVCARVIRNPVTRPVTGKPERGVLDFARFKRFFYVGFYVGQNRKLPILSNDFNGWWRRERDSNPRDGFPPTRFPGVRLRPLGHLSCTCLIARGRTVLQGKSSKVRHAHLRQCDGVIPGRDGGASARHHMRRHATCPDPGQATGQGPGSCYPRPLGGRPVIFSLRLLRADGRWRTQ